VTKTAIVCGKITLSERHYISTQTFLQLNFVTMMDYCFEKVLINITKSLCVGKLPYYLFAATQCHSTL